VGTDTDVGKTWVTCRLAEELSDRGLVVRAIKPLESGCDSDAQEDGVLLAQAAKQVSPQAALVRLAEPVAPPEAARRQGVELDWQAIVRGVVDAIGPAEIALVEGAGGLLSPLTWDRTAVDLAEALDAQVLLVAADRLGTLNHVRLTLSALDHVGLACPFVVLSAPAQADSSTGYNADALRRLPHPPVVFEAPRGRGAAGLADALLR
jgi:dethiobiotin synthetase